MEIHLSLYDILQNHRWGLNHPFQPFGQVGTLPLSILHFYVLSHDTSPLPSFQILETQVHHIVPLLIGLLGCLCDKSSLYPSRPDRVTRVSMGGDQAPLLPLGAELTEQKPIFLPIQMGGAPDAGPRSHWVPLLPWGI